MFLKLPFFILFIATCCISEVLTASRRPALTSKKGAAGYQRRGGHFSATSARSGIEASRGSEAADLPFVDSEIVEKYLDTISSYAERKAKMNKSLPEEADLKKFLIFNDIYDRTSRPVRNDETTMMVKGGISLYHILDVDEKLQLLSCVVSTRLSWFDEYLTWDPSEWKNISSILLPSDLIWLPDISYLNNADLQYHPETNVIVSNNGFVLWMFPGIVRTLCHLDLSWFPFDSQNCDLIMTSLAYDQRQLNVTTSLTSNTSYYDEHGQEWSVTGITSTRIELDNVLLKRTTAGIKFEIGLKRKPLFYLYTCVFPCIIIYFIALLSFFVPVMEQGGKIELPLTSLLSIVVLMMAIADSLTATETLPMITKIYAVTMVFCCLSLVFNAMITLVISQRAASRPVPPWLLQLTNWNVIIYDSVQNVTGGWSRFPVKKPYSTDNSTNLTSPSSTSSQLATTGRRYVASSLIPAGQTSEPLVKRSEHFGNEVFVDYSSKETKDMANQWEFVGKSINNLLCIIFLAMTAIGYTLCLPAFSLW